MPLGIGESPLGRVDTSEHLATKKNYFTDYERTEGDSEKVNWQFSILVALIEDDELSYAK